MNRKPLTPALSPSEGAREKKATVNRQWFTAPIHVRIWRCSLPMNLHLPRRTTRPRTGTVRELAGEDARATSFRVRSSDLNLTARPHRFMVPIHVRFGGVHSPVVHAGGGDTITIDDGYTVIKPATLN